MRGYIRQMTQKVQKAVNSTSSKKIKLGFDYIVSAEPIDYVVVPPPLPNTEVENGDDTKNNSKEHCRLDVNQRLSIRLHSTYKYFTINVLYYITPLHRKKLYPLAQSQVHAYRWQMA